MANGPEWPTQQVRNAISEVRELANAEVDNNSENVVLVDMMLASPDCD